MKCIPFLILLSAILYSCHTVIQTDFPPFEGKPTVNAILRAGDSIRVSVSMPNTFGDSDFNLIDNAEINVFEQGQFIEMLSNVDQGCYVSNTIVKPQTTYEFEIIIPEQETIYAFDSIPALPQILRIEHINKAGRDEEGSFFPAIEITFENNPEINQWFEIVMKQIRNEAIFEFDSILQHDVRIGKIEVLHDDLWMPDITDQVLLNEGLDIALFSNDIINSASYKMRMNYTSGMKGSGGESLYPLIVEFRSVSGACYNFKKQLYLQEEGRFANGIGESVTAIPLYSNVENGYGIVAGYSHCSTDTIIPAPYEF